MNILYIRIHIQRHVVGVLKEWEKNFSCGPPDRCKRGMDFQNKTKKKKNQAKPTSRVKNGRCVYTATETASAVVPVRVRVSYASLQTARDILTRKKKFPYTNSAIDHPITRQLFQSHAI